MGKSKNKKFKSPKPQPTGLPSVKDFETELEIEQESNNGYVNSSTVQNLIEKLSSTCEEERECGCSDIANLVSQPGAIPALMQQNVVKILGPLVLDHSVQVRHRALGALRNMSVDGGIEVCEEMVKADVLTSLVALYKQFEPNWVPLESTAKKNKDLRSEIFTEATHILWNLCEASQTAVDVFNKEGLVNTIWPCLQYNTYGWNLAVTVAQCLHTVTEDNERLSTICRQETMMALLQAILVMKPDSTSSVLLKILATGILINISGCQIASATGSIVTDILKTVAMVLDYDAFTILKAALSTKEMPKSEAADKLDYQHEHTENLDDVENVLTAQKVAVEIVTNLCCTEEDWEEMDNSESSSDELMGAEGGMEEDEGKDNSLYSEMCIPSEVHAAIISNSIFEKMLAKAEPLTDLGAIEVSNQRKMILKRFERLQTHSLLCVNNLVTNLDSTALGGVENLEKVLQGMAVLATSQSPTTRAFKGPGVGDEQTELLEAVTGALRAVIQKLAHLKSKLLSEVNSSLMLLLHDLGTQCPCREVRVNAIRIVATIGVVLSTDPTAHIKLKELGAFLIQVSCNDSDLWVVAETLDAIFDVFGEDHLDPILQELKLIDNLRQLVPKLKLKMKTSRKDLGEHLPVISTARTNLVRFIKYKSSLK